ncbi:MAG: Ku protein [Pseudonocardiales bacterium]|nr:Ku protein [Pseudonocardiales bacterium]
MSIGVPTCQNGAGLVHDGSPSPILAPLEPMEDEVAMRSLWKGAVSFGLVTIPVRLYSATEERDVSFHQVRRSDGSRIRYRRVAEADGEEVQYADIAKGYQLENGETVILTDEDFADLPLPTKHSLDVLQFVPSEQIDPIYFAKSYFLEPEKQGTKPYLLLREALENSGMVALVKVAIRSREQLATLRVRDGVIVLETMLWPDEIRVPDFAFLAEKVELRKQETAMAETLVSSMAGDFDPEEFSDDYRAALMEVIEAKSAGREVVEAATETPTAGNVVDLMAALRASVDAAKKKRSGEPAAEAEASGETPKEKAAAAKKAAAKKAPAKQAEGSDEADEARAENTAARKAPAKKAAAKRAPAKTAAAKAPAKKTVAATRRSA